MEGIAAQIRALIHANAPGMDQTVKDLPDIALVAAGPVALLIILILLFVIVGAIGGGGKKKRAAREPEPAYHQEVEPPSRVVRPTPPQPAALPPAPDKRGAALIEALRNARAPNAPAQSSEERLAQETAVTRVLKESPAAAKALLAGDVGAGLDKLTEEATALGNKPRAAQAWRDLGALAEGIDLARSLHGFESAFALDQSDFWGDVFLARMRALVNKPQDALIAAQAAVRCAKGPREKAVAQAELGDANLHLKNLDASRAAYQSAIEMLRSLARSGEPRAQRDLSVGLNKLGDLEMVAQDRAKAKAFYEEDLAITRHLVKSDRSDDMQRDLIICLIKLGDVTGERAYSTEANDLVEQLRRAGRLTPADNQLVAVLRKQTEAAG